MDLEVNSYGVGNGTPLLVKQNPNIEKILKDPNPPIVQKITENNRQYWKRADIEEKQIPLG